MKIFEMIETELISIKEVGVVMEDGDNFLTNTFKPRVPTTLYIEETDERFGILSIQVIHIGDGIIHVYVDDDSERPFEFNIQSDLDIKLA